MRNYKPYVTRSFKIPLLGFSLAAIYSVSETDRMLANSMDQAGFAVVMSLQKNPGLNNEQVKSLFLNELDGFLNIYFGQHAYAVPGSFTGAPTNNLRFQNYPSN